MNRLSWRKAPEHESSCDAAPGAGGAPSPDGRLPSRLAVVGSTGAGKTALAQQLSRLLGLPHVEIDALNWGPNWEAADPAILYERVSQALAGPAWVVDGNYSKVREITWGRAEALVWLDYPFLVVLGRLLWRTLRRIVTREALWGANRETWQSQFFSRDSLFLWLVKTHWRRRREYAALLGRPAYAHLQVVRLRSPRAARAWLATLEQASGRRAAQGLGAAPRRPAPR